MFCEYSARFTIFCANPLVLDDVVVVKIPQDFNFLLEVSDVIPSTLWLQGLHCHLLPGVITFWVIPAQLHLAKVALGGRERSILEDSAHTGTPRL